MIIGVFGPREVVRGTVYTNYNRIAEVLEAYTITTLYSGGGVGVEQLALRYAEAHDVPNRVIPPKIQGSNPRLAFERRNDEIASHIGVAIVFWDGKDRYYSELIGKLTTKGVHVHSYLAT